MHYYDQQWEWSTLATSSRGWGKPNNATASRKLEVHVRVFTARIWPSWVR